MLPWLLEDFALELDDLTELLDFAELEDCTELLEDLALLEDFALELDDLAEPLTVNTKENFWPSMVISSVAEAWSQ